MPARKKPTGSTQEERDRIALGRIESFMDGVIKGEFQCPSCKKATTTKQLSAGAAILLRSRYDKLRPSLSTIEQTLVDTRDKLNEEEVLQSLQGLISAKPDLYDKLVALRQPPVLPPPTATHEASATQQ